MIKRTTLALVVATLAVPAASAATAADRTDQPAAAPRTQLTFAVDDCEGCRIQLTSALDGTYVGDTVTLEEAVTRTRASACWEGVRRRNVTVPLVVEEVDGVHGRVPGSIAFVPTTESWLKPMRRTWDGVLGSQDVNICH